jgi:hypothetical protein
MCWSLKIVHVTRELTGLLIAVHKGGKLAVSFHGPSEAAKSLLSIGKGELHRVDVGILTVIITADFPSSHTVA